MDLASFQGTKKVKDRCHLQLKNIKSPLSLYIAQADGIKLGRPYAGFGQSLRGGKIEPDIKNQAH